MKLPTKWRPPEKKKASGNASRKIQDRPLTAQKKKGVIMKTNKGGTKKGKLVNKHDYHITSKKTNRGRVTGFGGPRKDCGRERMRDERVHIGETPEKRNSEHN